MKRVLFLVAVLSLSLNAFGQGPSKYTKADALEDIDLLSNGVLVVRLESDKRKLDVLEDRLERLDEENRSKVRQEIHETISVRDSFNLNLIKAFQEGFEFCPVFFI